MSLSKSHQPVLAWLASPPAPRGSHASPPPLLGLALRIANHHCLPRGWVPAKFNVVLLESLARFYGFAARIGRRIAGALVASFYPWKRGRRCFSGHPIVVAVRRGCLSSQRALQAAAALCHYPLLAAVRRCLRGRSSSCISSTATIPIGKMSAGLSGL